MSSRESRVGLRDFSDEHGDVKRRRRVGVAEEIHQEVHHGARRLGNFTAH